MQQTQPLKRHSLQRNAMFPPDSFLGLCETSFHPGSLWPTLLFLQGPPCAWDDLIVLHILGCTSPLHFARGVQASSKPLPPPCLFVSSALLHRLAPARGAPGRAPTPGARGGSQIAPSGSPPAGCNPSAFVPPTGRQQGGDGGSTRGCGRGRGRPDRRGGLGKAAARRGPGSVRGAARRRPLRFAHGAATEGPPGRPVSAGTARGGRGERGKGRGGLSAQPRVGGVGCGGSRDGLKEEEEEEEGDALVVGRWDAGGMVAVGPVRGHARCFLKAGVLPCCSPQQCPSFLGRW